MTIVKHNTINYGQVDLRMVKYSVADIDTPNWQLWAGLSLTVKAQNYLRPPVYGLFHSAILVEREMIPDRASRSIVNWSQLCSKSVLSSFPPLIPPPIFASELIDPCWELFHPHHFHFSQWFPLEIFFLISIPSLNVFCPIFPFCSTILITIHNENIIIIFMIFFYPPKPSFSLT